MKIEDIAKSEPIEALINLLRNKYSEDIIANMLPAVIEEQVTTLVEEREKKAFKAGMISASKWKNWEIIFKEWKQEQGDE